jgi:hypothetical protein
MKRTNTNLLVLALAGALAALAPGSAYCFNQPPLNFGATSVLDAGPVFPGLYLVEYVQFGEFYRPVDKNGDTIPGGGKANSLVSIHQLWYQTPLKVLGGLLALDFLQPVVAVTGQGALGPIPVTANTAGLGDTVFGAALQWNDTTLFGRPLIQ